MGLKFMCVADIVAVYALSLGKACQSWCGACVQGLKRFPMRYEAHT